LIDAGNTFAEAVMFSRRNQYPVTATALADSSVWCIDAEQFRNLLRQSTDACFAVLSRVTDRLYEQVAEIERLTLHTATSRFVSYLLTRIEPDASGRVVVRLEAPKSIIASRLSIVPETFSRSLAKLSREGLLEVHDSEIHLLDIGALKQQTADVLV
jgi:CRP-like cAMP-binding protein